jgi:hypothetical protein
MASSASAFPVRVSASRAALTDLVHRLGRPGLTAAADLPGLLAAVDQHAAALRDRLTDGRRAPSAIGLAGYAQGVRDAAGALGWHPPAADAVDWRRAHWLLVRLLAVCQLAVAAGHA